MRLLLWLTAILAALYSGYWVVGSRAALLGAQTTLSQMKAEGRADYAGLSLVGFPSRFDITIDKPKLISADGQTSWQAEFVQFLALSYQPNRIIAVWPHEQTVMVGPETLQIKSTDMRASLALQANLNLALDHATLDGQGLDIASNMGWQMLAEKLILASRQAAPDGKSHELALDLTHLAPGPVLRGLIDPDQKWPASTDIARADVIVDFAAPLDRDATTAPPAITALRALTAQVKWGSMDVSLSGDLQVDETGTPTGRLQLDAQNWRDVLAALVTAGVIDAELAKSLERGFRAVALAGGDENRLRLPLTFADGFVNLGPLPLGPAPRL